MKLLSRNRTIFAALICSACLALYIAVNRLATDETVLYKPTQTSRSVAGTDGPLSEQATLHAKIPDAAASADAGILSNVDLKVREAFAAHTAMEAVDSLLYVAEHEQARKYMTLISATCRGATRISAASTSESASVEAYMQAKMTEFLNVYCGDVITLKKKIAHVSESSPARTSEHDAMMEKLFFASRPTQATANAIINEILVSPDLMSGVLNAERLSNLSINDGPLAEWDKHMVPFIKETDRRRVFLIAGELITCPRLNSCGANQFYLGYQCLLSLNCRLGEDLFAYRRRTTSPELYQAAEQIANEMQARRYQ